MKASVIIPTYNACERLYYSLLAFNNQDCFRDQFEVIIVNNGSTDGTEEMLAGFRPNFVLSVVKQPSVKSRAYARNRGVENAQYDIIIFHDSDMIPSSNYVRKHIESHTSEKLVVCGNIWTRIFTYYYTDFSDEQKYFFDLSMKRYLNFKGIKLDKNKTPIITKEHINTESYQKYSYFHESFFLNLARIYGDDLEGYHFKWFFFVTRNCSVKKKDLVDIGLFDEAFEGWGWEDSDVGFRLHQAGHKFKVNSNIIGFHQEHPSLEVDTKSPINNKALIIFKHNCIDTLLYFFCGSIDIDEDEANNVMADINAIRSNTANAKLLTLFQEALILLREKILINPALSCKLDYSEQEIVLWCKKLYETCNADHFVLALKNLLKHVYEITIEL